MSQYQIVSLTCSVPAGGTNECIAHCPAGKTVLGGGVLVNALSATIFRSGPEVGVGFANWRGAVRAGVDATVMTTSAICGVVQ